MRIIDAKGRILGKVNVVDFCVGLFLLSLLPMFYFGHKLMTKEPEPEPVAIVEPVVVEPVHYIVQKSCPNCSHAISVEVEYGTLFSDIIHCEALCPKCKCVATLIEPKPKKKIRWPIRFNFNLGIF